MISIIVPIYNAEKTLVHCISSILDQSYADFEAILVDDGSPDKCGEMCDNYGKHDNRITVIHKPNGGVSSARNAGIQAAKGEYIAFCDSDDYLEKEYLQTLLKAKEENPDCGHVWCSFQSVSGFFKEEASPIIKESPESLFFSRDEFMELRSLGLEAAPFNKLFSASIIRDNDLIFPENYSLGEDLLFNLAYIDVSENKRFLVITKPLYNYFRGNSETLDTVFRPDLLEIFRSLNERCEYYFKKWGLPSDEIEKLNDGRFYQYERVFENTMKNPSWSTSEKISWNSMLLQSDEFKEVLYRRKCFVHPLFLKAYRSGDYKRVLFLQEMRKIKNSVFRKKTNSKY